MRQLFLFFVVGMSLIACYNSKPEQDLTIAPLKSSTSDTIINNSTTTQTLPQQMPAIPNNTVAATQTTMSQPVQTGTTAKGMNPAHGEPGHRCDISVGAPLNSAPTNTAKPAASNGAATITPAAAPTQNSAIVPALQNTSITAPAKTATAFTGKINPAHGQPGHDCKVAVGQPLP